MSEYSENNENMIENENVEAAVENAAEAVVETEAVSELVSDAETVEDAPEAEVAPEQDAEPKADVANLDDELFDKVNRAARLLRGRRDMMREEAEEDAARLRDLQRARHIGRRVDQREQPAVLAQMAGTRYQARKSRGIDERHVLTVHHHAIHTRRDQVVNLVAQLAHRRDIDVVGRGDHRYVVPLVHTLMVPCPRRSIHTPRCPPAHAPPRRRPAASSRLARPVEAQGDQGDIVVERRSAEGVECREH